MSKQRLEDNETTLYANETSLGTGDSTDKRKEVILRRITREE